MVKSKKYNMELLKNCHQEAYKPIQIGNGIWMPSDKIDYNSRETKINKYNENGLLFYEIKNGFEEKTVFMDLFPTTKLKHNVHSNLVEKQTYNYKNGGILEKITFISCLDKFEQEYIKQEFFYEKDSVICLHYSYNKPSYYEKTTILKDKKIVEYWNKDKSPYQVYEYYYDAGKLMLQVHTHLPNNCVQRYWEHEYDEKGNCIDIQAYNQKKVTEHCSLFEFDEHNNCVKEQLFFIPTGNLMKEIRTIYEYDDKGNWLRKVIYENNKIQCFVDNKM